MPGSSDTGILNNTFGMDMKFYTTAGVWPILLTIVKIWKDTGYGSVLYMSVLSGIDTALYEAAEIAKKDGEVLVIGHIRQKTLEALEIALPILESRKVAIVPIKTLVR